MNAPEPSRTLAPAPERTPADAAGDERALAARLLAEDLHTLAWLHAGERDSTTWLALRNGGFPSGLALAAAAPDETRALDAAIEALGAVPPEERVRVDDLLAADYAAIYLTHAHRASPCESVWRDDDHLMLQGPTFAVREAYRRHGMVLADRADPNLPADPVDRSGMPEDHVAHELDFVAHLMQARELDATARFLDEHLLVWLPAFVAQVRRRADTPLYAALASLTEAAVRTLRAALGTAAASPADAASPSLAGARPRGSCASG